jgi:hypothetical protein
VSNENCNLKRRRPYIVKNCNNDDDDDDGDGDHGKIQGSLKEMIMRNSMYNT